MKNFVVLLGACLAAQAIIGECSKKFPFNVKVLEETVDDVDDSDEVVNIQPAVDNNSLQPLDEETRRLSICDMTIRLEAGESRTFSSEDETKNKKYSCKTIFKAPNKKKLTIKCSMTKFAKKNGYLKVSGGKQVKISNKEALKFTSRWNSLTFIAYRKKNKKLFDYVCTVTASGGSAPNDLCECGERNPNGVRIVNGGETAPHEFPWQVSIVYANSEFPICGGSILNSQVVVTAAHCVEFMTDVADFQVIIGEHDITDNSYSFAMDIGQVEYHDDYDDTTLENDIALIFLASPLTFPKQYKRFGPACVASANSELEVGEIVKATGWGDLAYEGATPDMLQEVDLPIISTADCAYVYGPSIDDKIICTSSENFKGICNGDSGGPLVYEYKSGYYEQVGIVSAMHNCTEVIQAPSIFVKVSAYINWMKDNGVGELYEGGDKYQCVDV